MIGMKEFITKVLECWNSYVTTYDDMRNLRIPLIKITSVDTLQPHQSDQFIGLLGDHDQHNYNQDDNAHSTLNRSWHHITVSNSGKSHHGEIYHLVKCGGYDRSVAIILLIIIVYDLYLERSTPTFLVPRMHTTLPT